MVPPDSRGISGVPRYLGRAQGRRCHTCTGLSPTPVRLPSRFHFNTALSLPALLTARARTLPQPRTCNACQLSTHARFGLLRFRSPLLTESLLSSSPVGTEMFHFPTFPHTPLYIQGAVAGLTTGHLRGFPIRKSPDQSSSTSSPGLIAGHNVLHRLLVPRHPPIALSSLSNTHVNRNYKDARVHYEVLNTRTEPRTTRDEPARHTTDNEETTTRPLPHNPTACPQPAFHENKPEPAPPARTGAQAPHPPGNPSRHERTGILRKEVIQPHLPVRLPCYDLVLITSPTFDGSPHKGQATGFGCYRLS